MATLTIRDLDDALKQSLRVRAAHRNHSMEEEARQILRAALREHAATAVGLVDRVRARFAGFGDVELPLEQREAMRAPLVLDTRPVGEAARQSRTPSTGTRK